MNYPPVNSKRNWCILSKVISLKPKAGQRGYQRRTSDGGNGNHSVLLPIILIKIKVNKMVPSSYITSLLVSIVWFFIWFPISINVRLHFGAKMVTFCIIHIGNRQIVLKHHSPPEFQLILLHVSVFSIFTIIYAKSLLELKGGGW